MKPYAPLALFCLAGTLMSTAFAEDYSSGDFAATPLSLTRETTPLVMLAMSVDHQLFYKAYSDYTDLDGDGVIDTTYVDTFEYRGYFEPGLCYSYDANPGAGDDRFVPEKAAVSRADTNTGETINFSCDDDHWSGNFLNWATMTRVDMLRSVLYGGKRSTDEAVGDAELTVLERSHLPNDVHSFAKVVHNYDASAHPDAVAWNHILPDRYTGDSITLCSTTNGNGEPEIRIVEGVFESWASKEGQQCQYDGDSSSADTNDRIEDLIARVEVCAHSSEQQIGTRCRRYSDGHHKPIGLLQTYGEDGRIRFGLISGSYHRNLDGGVMRRLISRISGNEDASNDEVDQSSGRFNDGVNGIIQTLDRIQIAEYSGPKYDDCNEPGIQLAEIKGDAANQHCSNWGNPLGEVYYEALRYFSNAGGPLDAFAADIDKGDYANEGDFIEGLAGLTSADSWTDPFNDSNYCAECAIILLSSGTPSFDSDVTDKLGSNQVVGLNSADDLNALTREVGNLAYSDDEFISPDADGNCVATTVSDLSAVQGLCPEGPQVEGSYHIAGLAYHARTTDLRDDFDSDQNIDTYAIELGESVPAIEFMVDGSTVRLVPTCQSKEDGNAFEDDNYLGCSLYNFIVRDANYDSDGNLENATYIVFWEDSLWGNDYDLDGAQRIYICTRHDDGCSGLSGDDFSVKQQWVYTAAGFRLRASYSITGTESDGLNEQWTIKNDTDVDDGNNSGSSNFEFDDDDDPVEARTRTYAIDEDGTATPLLDKPLYLAAKYGGFNDKNGSGTPDLQSEWDEINNESGEASPDGIPDQYYQVRNPTNLINQLNRVFASIIERVASGSNAAVVANRSSGNGAIYQALYYPRLTRGDNTVSWVGQLHSLFVDEAGLIREDTNGNGRLDDYPTTENADTADPGDFIVDIYFNEEDRRTYFRRYKRYMYEDEATQYAIPHGEPQDLIELEAVWSAPEELARASTQQRSDYQRSARLGRYIQTALPRSCDEGSDEECDQTLDFDVDNVTTLAPFLGYDPFDQQAEASRLINYIRGEDNDSDRSRQIDVDGDGGLDTWRLGDIVHSTPAVVERPSAGYDIRYGDDSYESFSSRYRDRRRMIYVGGNDGMIHGFNGGYWSARCHAFYTSRIDSEDCPDASQVNADDHPLGSELFGYIPTSLLPHLRWLAEPDYPHVYYMDGEPMVFEARIFDHDDDHHPGGWGTLMVIGMRQGGGDITVDEEGAQGRTFRSGFVVLDITDPERPPELVAQISPQELGYSFSQPTLVRHYEPDDNNVPSNPEANKWYLVFGNGPGDANRVISSGDEAPRLFAYDLNERELASRVIDNDLDPGMALGFSAADWDRDGTDDAVYFGTVTGDIGVRDPVPTIGNQSGNLYRLRVADELEGNYLSDLDQLDQAPLTRMLDVDQPVPMPPNVYRAAGGSRWVHFGTGRFFANDDRRTEEQQAMYGVVEPRDDQGYTWGSVNVDQLVAAHGIKVYNNGGISDLLDETVVIDGQEIDTYDELVPVAHESGGWYREMTNADEEPAGRVLRRPTIFLDQLVFTEYLPSADMCLVDGRSNLYSVSWATGTALPYDPLGSVDSDGGEGDEGESEPAEVSASVDAGVGEAAVGEVFETTDSITLIGDDPDESGTLEELEEGGPPPDPDDDDPGNCVLIQTSTGVLTCIPVSGGPTAGTGRQSWQELEILF